MLVLSQPGVAEEQPLPARSSWVDSGHSFVSQRAQLLAQKMDDFYGKRAGDLEAAQSRIRVRFDYDWDEIKEGKFEASVRGKVQLPKLSKGLALVLNGDEGDRFDTRDGINSPEDNRVGFQYNLADKGRSRFDAIASVNSGLNLRLGGRYRVYGEFFDSLSGRFVQDLAYETGDKGAFMITRADVHQLIDDANVLAWVNRVEYGEDTYGVEWRSSLQWRKRLPGQRALTYLAGLDGVTDPTSLVENYGFAVNYRSTVFRDYLFVEVEPAYWWRKEDSFDRREGVWAVQLRFEINFDSRYFPQTTGAAN